MMSSCGDISPKSGDQKSPEFLQWEKNKCLHNVREQNLIKLLIDFG